MTGKRSAAGMLCKVCGDKASGRHYGVDSCDGCRGFFKRSVRNPQEYVCRQGTKNCVVDAGRRNQCQFCRFEKCKAVNMNRNAVQHARAPRSPKGTSLVGCKARQSPLPNPLQYFPSTVSMPNTRDSQNGSTLLTGGLLSPPNIFKSALVHLPVSFAWYQMLKPNVISAAATASIKPTFSSKRESSTSPLSVCSLPFTTADTNEAANHEMSRRGAAVERCQQVSYASAADNKFPLSTYSIWIDLLKATNRWLRDVPALNILPIADRLLLVEKSWCPLLILGAAQISLVIDIDKVMSGSSQLSTTEKAAARQQMKNVKEYINTLSAMNITTEQYTSVKALCIFTPGIEGLTEVQLVARLQEQAQLTLADRISCVPLNKSLQIYNCVALLSHIQQLNSSLLQQLFFPSIPSVGHFVSSLYSSTLVPPL